MTIERPEDTILWDGVIGNASFHVSVPDGSASGTRAGTACIHVNGVPLVTVNFIVSVGDTASAGGLLPSEQRRFRKAFASYASHDTNDVLARLQGICKVLPDLDVFYDKLSLRSGEDWKERLAKEIESRDVFYLFWSAAARNSSNVEWEWNLALEKRGIQYINPVPLISPRVVPPPDRLRSLHFFDWHLAHMIDQPAKK